MPISSNVPGIFGDISHDLYACDFSFLRLFSFLHFFYFVSVLVGVLSSTFVVTNDQCFDAVFSPMKLIIVFDNRFVVFYSGFYFLFGRSSLSAVIVIALHEFVFLRFLLSVDFGRK